MRDWTITLNDGSQPETLMVSDAELYMLLTRGHVVPKDGGIVRSRGIPRTSIAGLLLDNNALAQSKAAYEERCP